MDVQFDCRFNVQVPREMRDEVFIAARQADLLMSQWLRAAIREKLERDRNER
jgi:hypothetical protein